jgi:hypothetical protein
MARAMYTLGRVKLDDGDTEAGETLVQESITNYRQIRPGDTKVELDEDDFDNLIMSWSR